MRVQGTCGLLILLLTKLLSLCHCFNSPNLNKVECNGDKIFDQMKQVCAIEVGLYCRNTTECVSNAVCDQNEGICVCHGPDFSETEGGKCLKNYGMPCLNESDCNPYKHLTCRLGKCDCANSMEQGYSASQGDEGCIALPGEKCDLVTYYTSSFKLECGLHSKCSKKLDDEYHGICKCDPGYIRVGKNQPDCMPSFGSPCNSTVPCAPGLHLECDETETETEDSGVCKCEFNAQVEILNDVEKPTQCALLEGVSCIQGESICTQNAECKDINKRSDSICQCRFGYSRTPAGQCKQDDNLPCNEEKDNCNESIGLKCIGGTCRCSKGQKIDRTLKKCVIPVGQSCDPNISCANHAFCDLERGVCTCQKPMMPRPQKYADGFCYPGFGAPCTADKTGDYTSSCLGGNYLICGSQNICQCNNGSVFEEKSSQCFLPVGAKCSESRGDVCVSRATCEGKSGVGICDCGNGYVKGIKDGKCGLDHGKLCIPTEDECSREVFLRCIEMHKNGEYNCGCSEKRGLVYEEANKSCRSLNGFFCDNENGPFCSENSECVKNLDIGPDSYVCKCVHNFIADNSTKHRCVSENEFSSNQIHSSSIGNRILYCNYGGGWTGWVFMFLVFCVMKCSSSMILF